MVRVVAILAGIFLAAYLAVHLGYAKLEKELLDRSCCGIAELPVSETVNRVEGEKAKKSTPKSPAANKSHAPRTPLSATNGTSHCLNHTSKIKISVVPGKLQKM
jgi:hypothetical protein